MGYCGTDQCADGWCRCVEAARTDYGRAMGSESSDVRGARWLQVHDMDSMGEDRRRWRGLVGHRCGTARHEEGTGGDLEHFSPPRDCGELSSIQVVDRLLNGQPYSALSAPRHCLLCRWLSMLTASTRAQPSEGACRSNAECIEYMDSWLSNVNLVRRGHWC